MDWGTFPKSMGGVGPPSRARTTPDSAATQLGSQLETPPAARPPQPPRPAAPAPVQLPTAHSLSRAPSAPPGKAPPPSDSFLTPAVRGRQGGASGTDAYAPSSGATQVGAGVDAMSQIMAEVGRRRNSMLTLSGLTGGEDSDEWGGDE